MHKNLRKLAIWSSGFAAFAPILLMGLLFVLAPSISGAQYVLIVRCGLVGTAVIVLGYSIYALLNPAIPVALRIAWVPALVLGNILSVPAFWVVHVWTKVRRSKSPNPGPARPMLMTIGMFGAGLWIACSITGMILRLVGVRKPDQPVFDDLWTLGGLSFLVVNCFFAAIAFGIAQERLWVRSLVPAFWFYAGVEIVVFHQAITESLPYFILKLSIIAGVGGFACWYFYAKPNVARYYAVLGEVRSTRIVDPPVSSRDHR